MNDVNGFGGTVNQAVVHRAAAAISMSICFGGTVNQAVAHPA